MTDCQEIRRWNRLVEGRLCRVYGGKRKNNFYISIGSGSAGLAASAKRSRWGVSNFPTVGEGYLSVYIGVEWT